MIEFVKLARKCSFIEAVEFLHGPFGARPYLQGKPTSLARPLHHDISEPKLCEFEDINQHFFDSLSEPTDRAYGWLDNRGLARSTLVKMQVRFLLTRRQVEEKLQAQFPPERLIASGLLDERGMLPFNRHRLIWTYFNAGKPVYFQGRTLDSNMRPKEMCIRKAIPCPYNIDVLATKPSGVFVCEGVVDTLTLLDRGFAAVGVIGVHGFKEAWIDLFKGIRVKVAFDADVAGHAAAVELVQRFRSRGIAAEKVYLPEGCDVNRFFLALPGFYA